MTIHTRYYQNAGITLQVNSDLPFKVDTFQPKFEPFRVDDPAEDLACIHHHFFLPEIDIESLGKPAFHKAPWAIYPTEEGWTYLGILPEGSVDALWKVATFNHDHSLGHIYHPGPDSWLHGNLHALTTFPSDQIWLARLLAGWTGCYFHSAGVIINGLGFLFVGHSEAGKTTTAQMLIDAGQRPGSGLDVEILCDDRNIVRRRPDGWWLYGSWSHGEIPLISPASASLHTICFLEQAQENNLVPITDHQLAWRQLMACIIKPLVSADWWDNAIKLVDCLAIEAPCYRMKFNKSGHILNNLQSLL
jgi:hypothetical protein